MPQKLKIVLDKNPGMALKRPGSSLIVLNKNGYVPKTGDERRFAQLHQAQKWADRVGNKDNIYSGPDMNSVKYYPRASNRFGYDPGADQNAEFVGDKSRTIQHVATEDRLSDSNEDELNEISKRVAADYAGYTSRSYNKNVMKHKVASAFGLSKLANKFARRANNRVKGRDEAMKRLEPHHDALGYPTTYYKTHDKFKGPTLQQRTANAAAQATADAAKKKSDAAEKRKQKRQAAKTSETSAPKVAKTKVTKVTAPKVAAAPKAPRVPKEKKGGLGRGLKDLNAQKGTHPALKEWGGDRSDIGSPSTSNKPNMNRIPKGPKKRMVQDSGQPLNQGDYSLSSGGQLNGGLHEMVLFERTEQRACSLAQHIADHHMEPVFVHKFAGKDGQDVFSVMRKRHYDGDDSRFYGYNLTHVIQPTPPRPIRWNRSSKKAAATLESEEFDEGKKSALQRYYEKKYKEAGGASAKGSPYQPNLSAITDMVEDVYESSVTIPDKHYRVYPKKKSKKAMKVLINKERKAQRKQFRPQEYKKVNEHGPPVLDMHDNKVPHWPSKPIGEIPTPGQKAAQGVSQSKPGKKLNICTRFKKQMRPGNIHSLGAPNNPGTGGLREDEILERKRFLGKKNVTNYAAVLKNNHRHPHPALEKIQEDKEDFLYE